MRWLVVLLVLLFAVEARADAIPDGVRGVKYTVTFENVAAYPDYVFFVYPTTNSGYAYRVEPGKSVTILFMEEGRHGSPGTSLFAVKKAAFDKIEKDAYEHGDNNEKVQVFKPVPGAVKSNMLVTRPKGYVRTAAPEVSLARVFRIAKITDEALELTLVKNEMTYKDGTKKKIPFGKEIDPNAARGAWLDGLTLPSATPSSSAAAAAPSASAPATPPPEPKKRGCNTGGEAPAWPSALVALLAGAWLVRRSISARAG